MHNANEIFLQEFRAALIKYNSVVHEDYKIPEHLCPYSACEKYIYRYEESYNGHAYSIRKRINGDSFDLPEMESFRNTDVRDNSNELNHSAYAAVIEWSIVLGFIKSLVAVHTYIIKADANYFGYQNYINKAIDILSDKELKQFFGEKEMERIIVALQKAATIKNAKMTEPKILINCNRTINKTPAQMFYGV